MHGMSTGVYITLYPASLKFYIHLLAAVGMDKVVWVDAGY